MQIGGGVFLVAAGLGLVFGGLIGGPALPWGLALGLTIGSIAIPVSIAFGPRRWGQRRPKRSHVIVLWTAIVLQLAIFFALARLGYFRQWDALTGWTVGLSIVALHFVPMRWSHGPLMLGLAIALLLWIGAAYVLGLPLGSLITGDGMLKIVFGMLMAAPLFGSPKLGTA
jgi:hypothetical protein